MEENQELFEHYKFVADKGQSPLRVDKFLMNTKTNSYVLDSQFTTNGLQELRSNGMYTSFHKNGKIASKGETINGRRGDGMWTYWYENGREKSEEKLEAAETAKEESE